MLTLKACSAQENVQCVYSPNLCESIHYVSLMFIVYLSTKMLRMCTYLGTSVFLTCLFYFCFLHVVLYSLTSAAVLKERNMHVYFPFLWLNMH